MKHKSNELVRSYLLGRISDQEAFALEEDYFADSKFFKVVQHVEAALIEEYLDSKLPAAERESFEARYLKVPELNRKLEAVRRTYDLKKTKTGTGSFFGLRFTFALAVVVCVFVALVRYPHHPVLVSRVQPHVADEKPVNDETVVRLFPGVLKGGDSKSIEIAAPLNTRTVRLILELPGRKIPVEASCRLLRIEGDGHTNLVWSSVQIKSEPQGGDQAVSVSLPPATLAPADYMAQAVASDGEVLESFVFRVF
jgi:hypothetical protein